MKKLPADYIAGFVDGEGCFALKFRCDVRKERRGKPKYFYWGAEFAIVLRPDDFRLLELIRRELDCGTITFTKDKRQVRYSVQDIAMLKNKIVPFFKINRLFGKKWNDFILWSEAVEILYKNKKGKNINTKSGVQGFTTTQWNANDLSRLKNIYLLMRPLKGRTHNWKWLKDNI